MKLPNILSITLFLLSAYAILSVDKAIAQDNPQNNQLQVEQPYSPLEFLIGTWHNPNFQGFEQTFEWGKEKKYIKWTAHRVSDEGRDLQWDGLILWNGVKGFFRFIMPLVGSSHLIYEEGEFIPRADGSLRRDITVWYSPGTPLPPNGEETAGKGGRARRYRQLFVPVDSNTITSNVYFYQNETQKWVISFPESDDITFKRKIIE